jgi:hypothetical protein
VRFSIRTLQVPHKWGMGAFLPTPASIGTAATNGQNIVTGAPGTVRVPSPRPAAMTDSELGGPYNQPSSVAPDWFLPSIYVAHVNQTLTFPGRIFGDNVLPVPVPNVGRTVVQSQHRTRLGGRTATASLRPFTVWPTYNGRTR